MSDEYDFTKLKMNTVAEVRKERGVHFVLRENGAGADRAFDQLAEEMAALQVERMLFKQSVLAHFHRVGTFISIVIGALWILFAILGKFQDLRLAMGAAVFVSTLVDIYVLRAEKRRLAREAVILDRFRFFQSIVRTVPFQNGEKP